MDWRLPNKDWALSSASKFRLVEKLRENRGTALGLELGSEYRVLLSLQGRSPPPLLQEPPALLLPSQAEEKRFHRWKSEAGARNARGVHSAELSELSGSSTILGG